MSSKKSCNCPYLVHTEMNPSPFPFAPNTEKPWHKSMQIHNTYLHVLSKTRIYKYIYLQLRDADSKPFQYSYDHRCRFLNSINYKHN